MRPLMYGYLRVDLVLDEVSRWEERIRHFADREGFDLGMVFHEHDSNRGAFSTLIHELQRAESRHVVVPSMSHVWGPGHARHVYVSRLWNEASAGVWVADPDGNRIEVRAADRLGRRRGAVPADAWGVDDVDDQVEFRFAADASAVAVARVRVRVALSRWQLGELQAPAERIVSELVSEAVAAPDTAGPVEAKPLVVTLRRKEAVMIEVWDSRPIVSMDSLVNGRVAGLSSFHGSRMPSTGGTLTWCELPIPGRFASVPIGANLPGTCGDGHTAR